MTDNQKRPCCGAHVDSNDPCCTFREDELNAKMYAGWWAEATKERDEARRDLATARHEVAMLQACGAILLRAIYESGIAYDNPEVDLALAAFADSPARG